MKRHYLIRPAACFLAAAAMLLALVPSVWARGGKLRISTVDAATGKPVAVVMYLKNQRGRPVKPSRLKTPYWKDHFVIDGQIELSLPRGNYTFEVERGPEYGIVSGHFQMRDDGNDEKQIDMRRITDMSRRGWWSGELHIHRPVRDIEEVMRANDLHVGPVITWWRGKTRWSVPEHKTKGLVNFDRNRFYHDLAGEDERQGGALLYFNLSKPLDIGQADAEYPSPVRFLKQARDHEGVHVDIEKPFWWDVPVWLASGMVHSMGIAHNHMWRDGIYPKDEAWGRPRDKTFFPGVRGNGRWSERIYHHALNAGLRIAPSAGSASGVMPSPVGYNRVYVHCDSGGFSYENWWKNLRAGRVVVTNGPLILPSVRGYPPGHVFVGEKGQPQEFEIGLTLHTREKIEYLEIVKDGYPIHQVRLDDFVDKKGRLPKVTFDRSGWFLVRVVTNNEKTYRFASTGPYYVEYDYRPRVSKESAQFFLDWVDQRIDLVKIDDADQRESVLRYHRAARKFWQEKVDKATAE